jgi:hypothetical protein
MFNAAVPMFEIMTFAASWTASRFERHRQNNSRMALLTRFLE